MLNESMRRALHLTQHLDATNCNWYRLKALKIFLTVAILVSHYFPLLGAIHTLQRAAPTRATGQVSARLPRGSRGDGEHAFHERAR